MDFPILQLVVSFLLLIGSSFFMFRKRKDSYYPPIKEESFEEQPKTEPNPPVEEKNYNIVEDHDTNGNTITTLRFYCEGYPPFIKENCNLADNPFTRHYWTRHYAKLIEKGGIDRFSQYQIGQTVPLGGKGRIPDLNNMGLAEII